MAGKWNGPAYHIPARHQISAGDSQLLPVPTSAPELKLSFLFQEPSPAPGHPMREMGLQWSHPPSPEQLAPEGERRDTHPAEREPRRRQESPEGESPGVERPRRRRVQRELTSGGDGGLWSPQGSPAQLGPAGEELLPEKNRQGVNMVCAPFFLPQACTSQPQTIRLWPQKDLDEDHNRPLTLCKGHSKHALNYQVG